MFHVFIAAIFAGALGAALAPSAAAQPAPTVTVYAARPNAALFAAFRAATGIDVVHVGGRADEMAERLATANPGIDVLMPSDLASLGAFHQKGLFAPARSERIAARIPAALRHPDGSWFATFFRARVIFYNRELVDGPAPASYADLAQPRFRGKVCLGSGTSPYATAFLGQMLGESGPQATEQWVSGLVANAADAPAGHDPVQILNVGEGRCAATIANHYYFLTLKAADKPEERAALARVVLAWPDQAARGAAVNPGGAGLAAGAPNRANALAFLDFLVSDEAQALLAGRQFFPAASGVAAPAPLAALGTPKLDTSGLATAGERRADALALVARAKWPAPRP